MVGHDFTAAPDAHFDFDKDRLELPVLSDDERAALLLGGGKVEATVDGGASMHIVTDRSFIIEGTERPTPGLNIKTAIEGQNLQLESKGEALFMVTDKNGTELPLKLTVYVAPDCPVTLISERQLHTKGGGVHKVAGRANEAYVYWHVCDINGRRQTRVVPLTCWAGGYRLTVRPWTSEDDSRVEQFGGGITVGDGMPVSLEALVAGGGRKRVEVCSSAESSDGEDDDDGDGHFNNGDECGDDECESGGNKQLPELVLTKQERKNLINAVDLHLCAGHKSFNELPRLSRTLRGGPPVTSLPFKPACPPCNEGKAKKAPVHHRTGYRRQVMRVAQLWHADWGHMRSQLGPLGTMTILVLVFVCAFSGFIVSFPANFKTQAPDLMRHFHRQTGTIQCEHGPIVAISVDPGSELCEPGAPFGQVLIELNIEGPIVTPARRHEYHGKAERAIGVLGEIARAALCTSGLNATRCGERAWQYAVYIHNMTSLVKRNGVTHTPRGWVEHGRDARREQLHPFGCRATVLIPREHQASRVHPRGEPGVFLGWATDNKDMIPIVGVLPLLPGGHFTRLYRGIDVKFDHFDFPFNPSPFLGLPFFKTGGRGV